MVRRAPQLISSCLVMSFAPVGCLLRRTQCNTTIKPSTSRTAMHVDRLMARLKAVERERDAAIVLAADRLEQMQADRAEALRWRDERDALRSGASAYDVLLRANGPAWLQRVSGGSYSEAVADCKRAGWRPEPSNGWPDTDAARKQEGGAA